MSRGIRNGDYVKVTWVDSAALHGWRSMSDINELNLSEIVTIGHLFSRKGDSVRIASSVDVTSELLIHAIVIPKFAVTGITRLIEEPK